MYAPTYSTKLAPNEGFAVEIRPIGRLDSPLFYTPLSYFDASYTGDVSAPPYHLCFMSSLFFNVISNKASEASMSATTPFD